MIKNSVQSCLRSMNLPDSRTEPIGGYFELELPRCKARLYDGAKKFQSARAAFVSLLRARKPKKVWMPTYICDAMLAPVHATGIDVGFYHIDSDFRVERDLVLGDDECLLYVNYFGVCSDRQDELMQRFHPAQLIFDHSQAFFSPPRIALATIFSPRKFFGVPDGGLLITTSEVDEPLEAEAHSIERCSHLLKRLDSGPEQGYQDYRKAEETLSDIQPRRMSRLSERLLSSIDMESCRSKRNANFSFLHEHLNNLNQLRFDQNIDGPMCYPLLMEDSTIRSRLLANRIFVPRYWAEVDSRVGNDSFESVLVRNCLPLPCDHRYECADMQRIVDVVTG